MRSPSQPFIVLIWNFRPPFDHDQREEGERQRDQVGQLVQRKAVEQVQRAAAEKRRQRDVDLEEGDGGARLREALAPGSPR